MAGSDHSVRTDRSELPGPALPGGSGRRPERCRHYDERGTDPRNAGPTRGNGPDDRAQTRSGSRRLAMIRLRNIAIVAVLATLLYGLAPAARKARFLDKLREFGRALVISLVLFWLLIIGRAWFAN